MALLHFILFFCIYQALPSFANLSTKKCSPNDLSLSKIEKLYNVQISDLDYNITYDYNSQLTETSLKSVQIYFTSVDVDISGHFYPKEKEDADFKMDRKISTGPFTVNRTDENHGLRNKKFTCRVVVGDQLLPKSTNQGKTSMSQQERAEATVYALIVDCLETQICEQFNTIIVHDFLELTETEESVSVGISDYHKKQGATKEMIRTKRLPKDKTLQVAINSVFDFALAMAISKWTDSNGILHVPKIETSFSYLKVSGNFRAMDISFEGLRSFKRTADLAFSNNKHRYTMGTTIRLPKAELDVPSYYIKYGFAEVGGHLKLNIKGLSVKIGITVDYNAATCKVHLDEMNVHQVGDVDVDFVGLGMVWDKLAIKPIIRYTVRNYVFEKAKVAMADQVAKLNCETLRPTFETAHFLR